MDPSTKIFTVNEFYVQLSTRLELVKKDQDGFALLGQKLEGVKKIHFVSLFLHIFCLPFKGSSGAADTRRGAKEIRHDKGGR